MRKIFSLVGLLVFCLSIGKAWYIVKDGFSPRRIQALENGPSDIWSKEAECALSQDFFYIGRGRQSFAFASEDGKYVIKLLRTDIFKSPFWLRAMNWKSYGEKLRTQQSLQKQFVLNSFSLSYEELRNQTGVLALHLGKTESSGKRLTLVDSMGCKYRFPLENTSFILQYKQPILTKVFLEVLQKDDRLEAERILIAFLDLVIERGKKGILNKDASFIDNYGFDGQKAFFIDVGSFYRLQGIEGATAVEKSLHDTMCPVKEWLAKIDPQMLQLFEQQIVQKQKAFHENPL